MDRDQIRYQEWLERNLSLLERIGDIFTGLDERLDYLNRTLIGLEDLVKQIVNILKIRPPAPPPAVPPEVAPPPPVPPVPQVVYVQPPVIKFPVPFLISEDSGIASGGSSTTLRDDSRFWQDNILRGTLIRIYRGEEVYERVVVSNTYNQVTFSPLPTGVEVRRGDRWSLKPVIRTLPESAVSQVNRHSGPETEYQTVVSWQVSENRLGMLREISMVSDNYTKTRFRLTIADERQFEDLEIQTSLTLPYPNLILPSEAVVLLEAKSSDGTSITVDGSITGKELG
ncbi:MAG: hypothetical protein JRD89_12695 [Deltaproteobacteria bacterium]|nr:hypothetical protein [Deltaproteobacteria bacterium]